jgi:hypothetical protein
MLGTFINDHHRRIAKLVVDQRGQYAHRNAGRPDKNQRRIIRERFASGIRKAVFEGINPSSSSFSLVKQVTGSIAARRFASTTPPGQAKKRN